MRWTWTGRSLAVSSRQPLLVQPVCSPQPANVQPTSSPRPTHVQSAFSPPPDHVKSVGLSMDLTVSLDFILISNFLFIEYRKIILMKILSKIQLRKFAGGITWLLFHKLMKHYLKLPVFHVLKLAIFTYLNMFMSIKSA